MESSYKDKTLLAQRAKESFGQLKRYASKVDKGTSKVLLEHVLSADSDRKDLPSSGGNSPNLQSDSANPEFTIGQPGRYTPLLSGTPAPTVSLRGRLPIGLSLNPATGMIFGTPAQGTANSYPVTLTAHNGISPDATLQVMLIVSDSDLNDQVRTLEQLLAQQERLLGYENLRTLRTRDGLASAYLRAGRAADAIPVFEGIYDHWKRLFGPYHPETLRARAKLVDARANAYLAAGRVTNAVLVFERNAASREQAFGSDHPYTLRAREELANARLAAGETG